MTRGRFVCHFRMTNETSPCHKEIGGEKMDKDCFKWVLNTASKKDSENSALTEFLSTEEITKVQSYHSRFDKYEPTPLVDLTNLAKHYGLEKIWVKDESYRLGLNAFKVLGAAYAIGKYLAQKLEVAIEDISFEQLKSEETKKKLGQITFTTATDGNHGRAVAWAAQQLGQKAVVYMPKGSSQERLNAILETGAQASITDLNYDDAVRLSADNATKYGWKIIQDTAWEGYEEVPTWIMQGYATMAHEIQQQLMDQNMDKPTHIFLQAGVGSFAGAILGYYTDLFGENRPVTMVVEPRLADCIYKSALINDGKPHAVTGDMQTIMAGLACGEPNPIAWNILREYGHAYFSCDDYVTERGMRILANPLSNDKKVISGESGAVGMGLLSLLLESDKFRELREQLKLNSSSRVLIISTEGDTDPDSYRRILWG